MTQFSGTSQPASQTDGFTSGTLVTFAVGNAGELSGVYSNGQTQVLGQIALANFLNSAGLLRAGQNNFSATSASGAANIGTAGTGGRGTVTTGALEMSNVDLATQFTGMITAERGFQANGRVITTSDEMLQELVNLKR
jgi:flagellar hook protein FlgE